MNVGMNVDSAVELLERLLRRRKKVSAVGERRPRGCTQSVVDRVRTQCPERNKRGRLPPRPVVVHFWRPCHESAAEVIWKADETCDTCVCV